MPWCDPCDKYLAPNAVNEDGSCPTCEIPVDASDMKEIEGAKAPWHFWLMVIALVLYLGWRLIQFALWGVAKL